MPESAKVEFARRRRALMRLMGREAIAIVPAAPVRQRNNDVDYNYPPGQRFLLPHRLRRARGGGGADPGARGGRVRPVRARAQQGARDLGRQTRRSGRGGAGLRRRRCLPDHRHRRDPARHARGPGARVLHHGPQPGVRPARGRLGQRAARAGAQRHAPAAGIRGARSCAARHAAVQEPGGGRPDAPRRSDRGGRARARHALLSAGPHGIRGHGRAAARVQPPRRRYLLPPHRRRRRQFLRAALPRQQRAAR